MHLKNKRSTGFGKSYFTQTPPPECQETEKKLTVRATHIYSLGMFRHALLQKCKCVIWEKIQFWRQIMLVIHWLHKLHLTFIVYAAALAVIITCFNSYFWLSERCSCSVFFLSCGWRRSSSAVSPSASPVNNGAAGVGSD